METCVRGFSYMPESKRDVNLQYIENDELERAWKVNRRQRLKDQEQRIWEEFVKEQDMVQKAYSEDPYQFLHKLPEICLKELMETELNNMKKETQEEATVVEQPNQGEGDHPTEKQVHSVTFAEDGESPDLVMFHIFDDENDMNQSGCEEDQPESPSTVRERSAGEPEPPPAPAAGHCDGSDSQVAVKSTENVSNVIESSIYCARVKDIRLKLNAEMIAIMASLDIQDVMSVDRLEVSRRCRRAAEFCARFNRIHMYQLQRQIHNIKRHVSKALPFALHTQFQSQMLRVVSLHQNMLQALQVFHKSFPATSCLRECARALAALCALLRDSSALCAAAPAPNDFAAARDLYNDELVSTCGRVEGAVRDYSLRVADLLSAAATTTLDLNAGPSTSVPKIKKSKKTSPTTKTATKCWSTEGTEARLSMYSLDSQRLAQNKTGSRDSHSSGTSKRRAQPAAAKPQPDKDKPTKKIGRPLTRAPRAARARPSDGDITTMVQAVDTCSSGHNMESPRSRGRSPLHDTPRHDTPRHNTPRHDTPRHTSPLHSPSSKNAQRKSSPSSKPRVPSPKVPSTGRSSPKNVNTKKSNTTIKIDTTSIKTPIAPVTKIQCAKKLPRSNDASPEIRGKSTDTSKQYEKRTDRSRQNEKRTERSGKSTDRSGKSTDRSGKSTDRSRIESIRGRSKENDSGYDLRGSSKGRESDYRTSKFDKVNPGKFDKNVTLGKVTNNVNPGKVNKEVVYGKDENEGSDTDGSTGKVESKVVYEKTERPGHIGNPGKEDSSGREFCGVKELTDNDDDYSRRYAREVDEENAFLLENGMKMCFGNTSPAARCDVTRLLRQLCSGDPAGLPNERVSGAKNAQLLCVTGGSSPRQPSTPQLLRILEETIQKQTPRPMNVKPRNPERYRLSFNIPEKVASRMFQYRTKFVQHMLASPLYANSAVGRPWEVIGGVSDKLIDALLTSIAKEMEINKVLRELYKSETN